MQQKEIKLIIKTSNNQPYEVDNQFFQNCKTLKMLYPQMDSDHIKIDYDIKHFETLECFMKLSGEKQKDLIYQHDPKDLITLINLTEFLNCKTIYDLLCQRVAEITYDYDENTIKKKLGL